MACSSLRSDGVAGATTKLVADTTILPRNPETDAAPAGTDLGGGPSGGFFATPQKTLLLLAALGRALVAKLQHIAAGGAVAKLQHIC